MPFSKYLRRLVMGFAVVFAIGVMITAIGGLLAWFPLQSMGVVGAAVILACSYAIGEDLDKD
jgi:hypothetical protein